MRTESCRIGLGALLVGIGLVPGGAQAQDAWFAAGPVIRGGMKVKVDSAASHAQMAGLLGPTAMGPLAAPTGLGAPDAYADRTYDNGYVRRDPGTGVSPIDPNTTWNWGGGQYDSGSLFFSKKGAPADTSSAHGRSDEMLGAGLQLLAGLPLRQSGNWSVDLVLGFQGIWGDETRLKQGVGQVTVTDRYDVSGIPPASLAGFHGTYLGPLDSPPVVPSPVIPNQPTARSPATALDSSTFAVDQNLYQISLGPQVGWAVSSQLKLNLRPTISANILDANVRRTEAFLANSWTDQSGQRQVHLGFGVTGGADLDLGRGFFVGVFGGYEWVMEQMNIAVGPNRVSVDASGFVAGAVFGKRF